MGLINSLWIPLGAAAGGLCEHYFGTHPGCLKYQNVTPITNIVIGNLTILAGIINKRRYSIISEKCGSIASVISVSADFFASFAIGSGVISFLELNSKHCYSNSIVFDYFSFGIVMVGASLAAYTFIKNSDFEQPNRVAVVRPEEVTLEMVPDWESK